MQGPGCFLEVHHSRKDEKKKHLLAAARWAYHVAKDLAASTEHVSIGKKDSLLEGRALAVEDAAGDDDLALQVGRLIALCEDCVSLDLDSVINRAPKRPAIVGRRAPSLFVCPAACKLDRQVAKLGVRFIFS